MNLKALAKRKFKVTTDSAYTKPVYENSLNRDFTTTAVNQKWAGDITYVVTEQGWLSLAVIINLHSRAIIEWSMNALVLFIWREGHELLSPPAEALSSRR